MTKHPDDIAVEAAEKAEVALSAIPPNVMPIARSIADKYSRNDANFSTQEMAHKTIMAAILEALK